MAIYKITFTPSGPYFFGNEKTFEYKKKYKKANPKEDNIYFIRGEATPSQSTVFGSLRYLLLPEKGFDKLKFENNIAAIGEEGFDIDSDKVQEFGKITRMSALFISKGNELFIPTPFDHRKEPKITEYTPFKQYSKLETVDKEEKLYTEEYDAKEGISDSFMSLENNRIYEDLIGGVVRVGINRKDNKEGFFKREYKYLKEGYSFCVYAEIDNMDLKDQAVQMVTMGQGKVPFAVKFEIENEIEKIDTVYEKVEAAIKKMNIGYKRFYCLSDMVVGNTLYENTKFAVVQTRDHRGFKRNDDRYTKSMVLHRLVKAGSVFLVDDNVKLEAFAKTTINQKNSYTIGYNQIITIQKA